MAADLKCSEVTVGKWRKRLPASRLEGLADEPRVGRPSPVTLDRVEEVIVATWESKPTPKPTAE